VAASAGNSVQRVQQLVFGRQLQEVYAGVREQELVQRVVKGVIARSREPVNSRERAVWGCCSHAGVFNTN